MSRSFDIVDNKLREADFFLEELRTRGSFSTRDYYFSAFLSASRSVTFALQATLSSLPGFAEWYADQRAMLATDPNARWLVDARNQSEKQGATFLGFGLADGKGGYAHFPLVHLNDDPRQTAREIVDQIVGRKTEDALGNRGAACMRVLAGIVLRCYQHFGTTIDPERHYSVGNLARVGKSVEDVEQELGFPRGWTAGGTAEERINALKRSIPMPHIDDLLLKYVGLDRFGNLGPLPHTPRP